MTNLAPHIEAMQKTALALEEHGRKVGYYSADCDTLDAAIKAGRGGVAIIFDEDGEPEVFALGGGNAKVSKGNAPRDWTANYVSMSGREWELAVRQSHEMTNKNEGKFKPVNVPGVALDKARLSPLTAMADAARLSPLHTPSDPERRAKQAADTAKAKADYQAGIARTAEFAAKIKEESAKIHK